MSAESEDQGTPHQFVLKNIPWLATLSLLALVVAKLLTVAHFNTTTALALVDNSGIVTIALGTLVPGLPLLLYAVWLVLFQLCNTTPKGTLARAVLFVPLLFVAVLLMWLGTWVYIPLIAVSFSALFGWPSFKRRSEAKMTVPPALALAEQDVARAEETLSELQLLQERLEQAEGLNPDEKASEVDALAKAFEENMRPRVDEDHRRIAEARASLETENKRLEAENKRREGILRRLVYATLVISAIGAMVPFLSSRPWLPEERIELVDRSVHTGYVVQQSEGSIVFMTDSRRAIERFSESDVANRFVCIDEKPSTNWLWAAFSPPAESFVGHGPDYPLCAPPPPPPSPSPSPSPTPA